MTFLVQLIVVMSIRVVTQTECVITVKSGFGGVILGIYQQCQGLTWSYSVAQSCPTLCDPVDCSMPGFPVLHISQSLLKLLSTESVMPSTHLILCRPLFFLPSIFPRIRVFSNESVLHIRWTKYWSCSFSISPSNEYSGLISFSMDWLDLLAVQGTLKSFLQHYSSKASILLHSAFFIVQLSHPYMTTGKTITSTRWTFVSKVMSVHFNMLLVWLLLPG